MPSRRAVLRGAPVGLGVLAGGCQSVGHPLNPSQSLTAHHGGGPVASDHDQVRLRARRARVARGEAIGFDVANVGDAPVALGCGNPWTLHQRRDGRWRDVLRTSAVAHPQCATRLQPGESIVERVTIPTTLANRPETVAFDLTPGRYRFVLLGTDPFLAADFRLTAAA